MGILLALLFSVEFNRDIRPILSDRCYTCHGPDAANRKAGLRFDTEAGAKAALVPGAPGRSKLYIRVSSTNKAMRMPPAYMGQEALAPREIELMREWIAQGAKWEKHWSFIPPKRPEVPPGASAIDYFVRERLAREGLRLSPEADRATLVRRVTLDLTGLPPTPAEVEGFERDGDYEKVVDRLLASPRYAERMAIRWLEAARYADTNGYQTDGERSMWRWRDWVIDAFRRNMPFDQFTTEQIAGDLLPEATRDQIIATAFHRNHRTSGEGGIVPEEFRTEYVAERAETTSTVWLGLTMGCARCHDHKYDPIGQKDFYSLFAFFNNLPEKGLVYNFGNEEPFIKAPTPEQEKQLAELNAKAAEMDRRYLALETKREKAQRRWEQSRPKVEWTVTEGLVRDFPDEKQYDGKAFTDGGDIAKFSYLDPFSIAAWVNPASPDGAIATRTEDYFEGEGYGVYLIHGKIRLHIIKRWTDIGLRVETVDPVELDRWQHVAVTYDGHRYASGVHIYVDGVEKKLKVLFDDLNYPLGAKDPFRIGGGGGLRFRGSIRDVRVYRRALSAEEASVLPLGSKVGKIAAIPDSQRTPAQQAQLTLCFLERYAPERIRKARREMMAACEERTRYYESIQTVMVMKEGPPRDAFVLKRGAYDAPGEKVSAGVPEFLLPWRDEWPSNRLGLARWLVDPANPLTARVAVNRFWQMYFGTGLVKTVEDFGSQGEWPIHPELLDWLATEFVRAGWDMRALQKTIVMSATYRQSSKATPEMVQKDPENRLLGRGPRFRLPAEMIRDQALAISGLLVEKVGGPPVKPYQPPGLWQELAGGRGYVPDAGEGLHRRSLYTYWKRTVAPPSMVIFDSPNRETCSVRAVRTNTPLQALDLMNDVAYVEAARAFAARIVRDGGKDRFGYAYRLALARPPKPAEVEVLRGTLEKFRAYYAGHPEDAVKFGGSVEGAAWTGVAGMILNLDEVVTKQ